MAHEEATGCLDKAIAQLKKYHAWSVGFIETLARAKRASADLDGGLVWQDEFVDFWEPFTSIQLRLFALYDRLHRLNGPLADLLEAYIDPPSTAQIEYATAGARFLDREGYSRKQIAYDVARLETWHQNFDRWLRGAVRELESARREL